MLGFVIMIIYPTFPGDGDIERDRVNGFKRSEGGRVVVLMDNEREPEWIVPDAKWDEFCGNALAWINKRELESRNRD